MNEEVAVLVHHLLKENVQVKEQVSTREHRKKNTMTVILTKCVVDKVSDRRLVDVMIVLATVVADLLETTMTISNAVTNTDHLEGEIEEAVVGTIIDLLGAVIWVIEIREVVTMVGAVVLEEALEDVTSQDHGEETFEVEEGEEAEVRAGVAISEDEDQVEAVILEGVLGAETLIIEIHVEEMVDSEVGEVVVAEVALIELLTIGIILAQKCLTSMVR